MDESVFSRDRCQYLFFCNAQCFLINASPDRNTKGAGAQKYLNVNYYYTSRPHLSPYVTKEQIVFSAHCLLHLSSRKTSPKQYSPQKGGVREQDLLRFLGKQTSHKIFNWIHPHNSSYSRLPMLVYTTRPSKWKKVRCSSGKTETPLNIEVFLAPREH